MRWVPSYQLCTALTFGSGELNLGTVLQLSKEKVIDGWYALVGKKEQSTSAKIHLRLYYSTMPGTAPAKGYYHHAFMYGGVANRIKSGDLIGVRLAAELLQRNLGANDMAVLRCWCDCNEHEAPVKLRVFQPRCGSGAREQVDGRA